MTPVSAGILYRIAEWFLTVLPVDASGRRVFDETLADWRREVGHAQAWHARLFVAAGSSAAVLRGLALVFIREVHSREGRAAFVRLGAWTAAGFVIFLGLNWELLYVTVQDGRALYDFDTLGLLSVSWLAGMMPVLAFLSAIWARNTGSVAPRLGPALAIGVLMLLVMGWAVPAASQAFREITFIRAGGVGVVPSGMTAAKAVFQLRHGLLWATAVPVLLVLGTVARSLAGWRRLAGSVLPLVVVGVPFVVISWPNRLYVLWGALLAAVLLMRLLAGVTRNQHTNGNGSLVDAGRATS